MKSGKVARQWTDGYFLITSEVVGFHFYLLEQLLLLMCTDILQGYPLTERGETFSQ